MQKVCLGQMRMDYTLYNRLPLVDIVELVAGFFALERQRERQEWERCRWQTAVLLNIHIDQKKRIKPKELLPFPWDEQKKKEEPRETPRLLTEEHRKKVAARMDREMRLKWEEEQRKKKANGVS